MYLSQQAKNFSYSKALKFEIVLFNALVLWDGKNFLRKYDFNSFQFLMLWGLKRLNQILALSFNVNGKNFMHKTTRDPFAA